MQLSCSYIRVDAFWVFILGKLFTVAGQHGQAITVHKMLIARFPKVPKHRNDLAVSYLMVGRYVYFL